MAIFCFSSASVAQDMTNLGIVTGSKTGTYFQIGNDINKIISYVCQSPVSVRESAGSLDNLRRLRKEEFVQLAIVQHDVLSFAKVYKQDDKELQDWVSKFRYIYSLYPEEVHIVTRKDSGIRTLRDLENRRVGVGLVDSGTQITATFLLRLAGLTIQAERAGPEEALNRLFLDRSDPKFLDAFFMVVGKPFKLLSDNNPRLKDLTLVTVDDERVFSLYKHGTISRADYAWLDRDIETAATLSALVTFDFRGTNCDSVAMIARQIEANLEELQRIGHPKWNEVRLKEPVPGWERYQCVTARLTAPLKGCRFTDQAAAPVIDRTDRCKHLSGPEKIICELGR